MLMLNVLQSYYEYSHDARVSHGMTRYFRWELKVPDADFMAGYWPKMRAGDNLESVYWLYNRTGEPWLLDLASQDSHIVRRLDRGRDQLARCQLGPGLPRAGRVISCRPAIADASSTPPNGTTRW